MLSFGPTGSPRLLLSHHVARRLHKSVRTVRRYAETGKLPAFRSGKLWRFDELEVEKFRLHYCLPVDEGA
jgi:excisionase family DNA binding protein